MQLPVYARKIGFPLVVLALLIPLAACNSPEPKVPHVKYETVSHAMVFEKGKRGLNHSEFTSLETFMHTVPTHAVSYAGVVADDTDTLQLARARALRNYLVKMGVSAGAIHLQPVAGKEKDTMLLTLEYAIGVPPEHCPDWSKNAATNYNNTRFSNFGCAYNNNLITQLSDPADYDRGYGDVEISAARDSVGLQKYYSATAGTTSSSGASSSGSSSGGAGSSGASSAAQ